MTLADLAAQGLHAEVWSEDYRPEQWWWCKQCQRAQQAAEIRVGESRGGGWRVGCAYCRGAGSGLYWYHGWPSLVLEGWQRWPTSGRVYPLPVDWEEAEIEEPGCSVVPACGMDPGGVRP